MIRLRQSLEAGLRHPLLGPLLLLLLGLVLAFMIIHTLEHGVEGLLFSCAVLAAIAVRLVVVLGRTCRPALEHVPLLGRAPPTRRLAGRPAAAPPAVLALPLRL